MRAVVLISGGLDSIVLSHYLAEQSSELLLLSINYGQRNRKEFSYASAAADRLHAEFELIQVPQLAAAIPGYSLTDTEVSVPSPGFQNLYPELHGGDAPPPVAADELTTRPAAVNMVPNRNVILLSIAYARAVSWRSDQLAFGALAGSAVTTPDTSPEFVDSFNAMESAALRGYVADLPVTAPFIKLKKYEVVGLGQKLGVPFEQSWSCFNNLADHCGACHACGDRRAAFVQAGVPDPTTYLA